MVSKNHPDSLPSGWKLQINVKNGRKFKCYVHSKTSQKLYSKLAVLRYVKDVSAANDCSGATPKHAKKNSQEQEVQPVVADDSLEGLPAGWTVEVKNRQSGSRKGNPYKCFTELSSGSKFYSKPEVYRYLQSLQNSSGPSRQEERRATRHSSSNRPVDQRKGLESNVEPNVSTRSSKTAASMRLSSGKAEPNVSENSKRTTRSSARRENSETTASRRLSSEKIENSKIAASMRLSAEKKEPNVSTNPNTTPRTRLSLERKEPNMSMNPNTTPRTRLSLERKEPNVSVIPDTTPRTRLSLQRKEPNVSSNPSTTPRTRLSFQREEPNVSLNPSTTPRTRLSLQRKEPNVSLNSSTTPCTRLSLESKEPNVSLISNTTPRTRLSSQRKEPNVSQNPKATQTTPTRGPSLEKIEPNVSLNPNKTPCTRLSSERKEPNVSPNPNTTPCTRLSSERKEPDVSLSPNTTPHMGLSSEREEPNVSHNPKTTQTTPSTSRRSSSKEKKVVVENTVDKDLPSGWIKEMRKRFRGTQAVRTDPFYFHPASGLVFRSKREVLRYLETGEISRHAYWRRNYVDKEELASEKNSPTPSVKRVTRANSDTQKEFSAGEKTSKESPSSMPESHVLKENAVRRITRSSSQVRPASVSELELNQRSFSPEVQDDKGKLKNSSLISIDLPSTSATSTLENTVSAPIKGCSGTNKKAHTTKRKSTDQNSVTLSPRSSKRLAGVDVQAVFHSIPLEHARLATSKKSVTATPSTQLDAETQTTPASQQAQHFPLDVSIETVLATEEPLKTSETLIQTAPPIVSEVKAVDVPPTNTERPSENSADHPILERKPDADVGNKTEKSTPGFPVPEEQPGTEFSFPPPLWSDPCLEFAYKTLTGAIPLDDNLAIEDYIQYQLHTSKQTSDFQSLPDIDMGSFPQNDETKLGSPLPEVTRLPNGNGLAPDKPSR